MRVEVSDLEKLAILQNITHKPTADVVRAALKAYIAEHEEKLRQAGTEIAQGTYWDRREADKG